MQRGGVHIGRFRVAVMGLMDRLRQNNGSSVSPYDDVTVTKVLDANRYASKKTLAQGMLDIALLTANASQLKYILQVGKQHEFYTLMVTLISISIVLQVVMGCLALSLNMLRDCRLHRSEFRQSALCLNYMSLIGAFTVSAVNLVIAVFNPRPVHPTVAD